MQRPTTQDHAWGCRPQRPAVPAPAAPRAPRAAWCDRLRLARPTWRRPARRRPAGPGRYQCRAARWSADGQPERLVVGGEVERDQPAGRARHDRRGQLRAPAGAAAHWCTSCPARRSASRRRATAATACGQAGGSAGTIRTASTCPAVDRHRVLPADRDAPRRAAPGRRRARRPRCRPRAEAIGSTRPRAPTIAAAWSSAATGSPSISISPSSSRLPTACPASGSSLSPGRPSRCSQRTGTAAARRCAGGRVVGGQRGQRLPQVARRQQGVPLGPQPAAGPAVVADRDHRGDVQVELRAQRRSAAQRGAPARARRRTRPPGPAGSPAVVTPAPGRGARRGRDSRMSRSRAVSSSAIATLRCLPPVQPTATVR